jgi:hypothetical protein
MLAAGTDQLMSGQAIPQAQPGKQPAVSDPGVTEAAQKLVAQNGLTKEELFAIRAYTGSNYLHINPATANAPGWMKSNNKNAFSRAELDATPNEGGAKAYKELPATDPYKSQQKKLQSLAEEGSLHGAVALSGLQKLPAKRGDVFRGARLSEAELKRFYPSGQTVTFHNLTSTARQQSAAQVFANAGGETAPRADQTISVMATLKVTNARDLQELSVYGAHEAEWILLPGATFHVGAIEDLPTGLPGLQGPPATRWVKITLTQTK